MTQEEMQKYESGFNEGVLFATQAVTSLILPGDRTRANAMIQLTARNFLQKRKLVPSTYAIMRGEAEDVKLDFYMDV